MVFGRKGGTLFARKEGKFEMQKLKERLALEQEEESGEDGGIRLRWWMLPLG